MKRSLAILAAAAFLAGCSPQDQGGTGTDTDTTTGTGYQAPGSGTAADTGLGAITNQTGATNQNIPPAGGTGANTNIQSGAGSQSQPAQPQTPSPY